MNTLEMKLIGNRYKTKEFIEHLKEANLNGDR